MEVENHWLLPQYPNLVVPPSTFSDGFVLCKVYPGGTVIDPMVLILLPVPSVSSSCGENKNEAKNGSKPSAFCRGIRNRPTSDPSTEKGNHLFGSRQLPHPVYTCLTIRRTSLLVAKKTAVGWAYTYMNMNMVQGRIHTSTRSYS